MATIARFLDTAVGYVWGTPLVVLLTFAGLLFTLRTLGIQWRILSHGLAVIRGKYDNPHDPGNISHFQALCAALSATIGLGNIAGVAVAVAAGGPGAVFWMWVVGFLGMATKFTTCSLAVMYRSVDAGGTQRGGPMWYIERGLGRHWKPLAVVFAILGAVATFGGGNMFQSHQVADVFKQNFHVPTWLTGGVLILLTGMVIVGGIKRIGRVAGSLVPVMCVIYVGGALTIILLHADRIPGLLADILHGAFSGTALTGAFAGVAFREVLVQGARRACFSNEAGLGSAPMAHATARTNEPIREGIVAGIGPFIDTIVICTMTALVILISGALFRDPVGRVVAVGTPQAVLEPSGARMLHVTLTVEPLGAGPAAGSEDRAGPAAARAERLFVRALLGEDRVVDLPLKCARFPTGGSQEFEAVAVFADDAQGRRDLKTKSVALAAGNEVFLDRQGVNLTADAFDRGIPRFGAYFVPLAVFLFALSTMISWSFYGETCTEYLLGEKAVLPFKLLFLAAGLIGAMWKIGPVLNFSDVMFGLMVVPNLLAAILLSGRVAGEARRYFARLHAGEFDTGSRGSARPQPRHPAE